MVFFSSFNINLCDYTTGRLLGNKLILEEMQYDKNVLKDQSRDLYQRLNCDHLIVCHEIIDVANSSGFFYFVSGHGGTRIPTDSNQGQTDRMGKTSKSKRI